MEAAIWVTADGRKRLKRFSGGFSGQNRWVVGGENGVSGVRLELATQRSMKVHDILGGKWLRRLKSLEKLSEASVGLWIRVVTALLLPFCCSEPLFMGNLLLPHFPEAQDFHRPPFAYHPLHFIYYRFPDRKTCSILSSHRGKACFYWDKQQQDTEKDGCQRGFCSCTFLK